ncbi:hypothetical protein [Metabacillus endolithicus]|uniref:Uncharacterized protein n=1 Tax=Metabacillus endolithicus TaxID=1535204 RepID=A0ABW5C1M4_9BACI|nr:hypothetical protein [Metabacillus endolithicus]UPG65501.1 hypothetical protein MVE64_11320 [Metabacillus endolithicus]
MGSMFGGNWIKESLGMSTLDVVMMVMFATMIVNVLLFRFGGKRRKDSISFFSSLVFVGAGQFYKRKWIRGSIITGLFVGCSFYKLNAGESFADNIIVIMTLVSPIEAFVTGNESGSSGYSSNGSSSGSSSGGSSSYGLADQMEDEQLGRFQDDLHDMSNDYNHHY